MTEKMSRTSYQSANMAFHTNTLNAIFPLFLKLQLPASGGALAHKTTHPSPTYIVVILLLILILIRSIISVRMFLWQMFVVIVLISTHSRRSSSRLRFLWGLWVKSDQIRCELAILSEFVEWFKFKFFFFHRNVVDPSHFSCCQIFVIVWQRESLELQSKSSLLN